MPDLALRTAWLLVLGASVLLAGASAAHADGGRARNGGYLGFFLRETADAITIERLHPGSMASSAGFEAGDIIVAVNGKALENGDAFIRWLWSGRQLEIQVKRGEATHTIRTSTRELDALPQLEDKAHDFTLPSRTGRGTHSLRGLLENGRPVVLVFGSFT